MEDFLDLDFVNNVDFDFLSSPSLTNGENNFQNNDFKMEIQEGFDFLNELPVISQSKSVKNSSSKQRRDSPLPKELEAFFTEHIDTTTSLQKNSKPQLKHDLNRLTEEAQLEQNSDNKQNVQQASAPLSSLLSIEKESKPSHDKAYYKRYLKRTLLLFSKLKEKCSEVQHLYWKTVQDMNSYKSKANDFELENIKLKADISGMKQQVFDLKMQVNKKNGPIPYEDLCLAFMKVVHRCDVDVQKYKLKQFIKPLFDYLEEHRYKIKTVKELKELAAGKSKRNTKKARGGKVDCDSNEVISKKKNKNDINCTFVRSPQKITASTFESDDDFVAVSGEEGNKMSGTDNISQTSALKQEACPKDLERTTTTTSLLCQATEIEVREKATSTKNVGTTTNDLQSNEKLETTAATAPTSSKSQSSSCTCQKVSNDLGTTTTATKSIACNTDASNIHDDLLNEIRKWCHILPISPLVSDVGTCTDVCGIDRDIESVATNKRIGKSSALPFTLMDLNIKDETKTPTTSPPLYINNNNSSTSSTSLTSSETSIIDSKSGLNSFGLLEFLRSVYNDFINSQFVRQCNGNTLNSYECLLKEYLMSERFKNSQHNFPRNCDESTLKGNGDYYLAHRMEIKAKENINISKYKDDENLKLTADLNCDDGNRFNGNEISNSSSLNLKSQVIELNVIQNLQKTTNPSKDSSESSSINEILDVHNENKNMNMNRNISQQKPVLTDMKGNRKDTPLSINKIEKQPLGKSKEKNEKATEEMSATAYSFESDFDISESDDEFDNKLTDESASSPNADNNVAPNNIFQKKSKKIYNSRKVKRDASYKERIKTLFGDDSEASETDSDDKTMAEHTKNIDSNRADKTAKDNFKNIVSNRAEKTSKENSKTMDSKRAEKIESEIPVKRSKNIVENIDSKIAEKMSDKRLGNIDLKAVEKASKDHLKNVDSVTVDNTSKDPLKTGNQTLKGHLRKFDSKIADKTSKDNLRIADKTPKANLKNINSKITDETQKDNLLGLSDKTSNNSIEFKYFENQLNGNRNDLTSTRSVSSEPKKLALNTHSSPLTAVEYIHELLINAGKIKPVAKAGNKPKIGNNLNLGKKATTTNRKLSNNSLIKHRRKFQPKVTDQNSSKRNVICENSANDSLSNDINMVTVDEGQKANREHVTDKRLPLESKWQASKYPLGLQKRLNSFKVRKEGESLLNRNNSQLPEILGINGQHSHQNKTQAVQGNQEKNACKNPQSYQFDDDYDEVEMDIEGKVEFNNKLNSTLDRKSLTEEECDYSPKSKETTVICEESENLRQTTENLQNIVDNSDSNNTSFLSIDMECEEEKEVEKESQICANSVHTSDKSFNINTDQGDSYDNSDMDITDVRKDLLLTSSDNDEDGDKGNVNATYSMEVSKPSISTETVNYSKQAEENSLQYDVGSPASDTTDSCALVIKDSTESILSNATIPSVSDIHEGGTDSNGDYDSDNDNDNHSRQINAKEKKVVQSTLKRKGNPLATIYGASNPKRSLRIAAQMKRSSKNDSSAMSLEGKEDDAKGDFEVVDNSMYQKFISVGFYKESIPINDGNDDQHHHHHYDGRDECQHQDQRHMPGSLTASIMGGRSTKFVRLNQGLHAAVTKQTTNTEPVRNLITANAKQQPKTKEMQVTDENYEINEDEALQDMNENIRAQRPKKFLNSKPKQQRKHAVLNNLIANYDLYMPNCKQQMATEQLELPSKTYRIERVIQEYLQSMGKSETECGSALNNCFERIIEKSNDCLLIARAIVIQMQTIKGIEEQQVQAHCSSVKGEHMDILCNAALPLCDEVMFVGRLVRLLENEMPQSNRNEIKNRYRRREIDYVDHHAGNPDDSMMRFSEILLDDISHVLFNYDNKKLRLCQAVILTQLYLRTISIAEEYDAHNKNNHNNNRKPPFKNPALHFIINSLFYYTDNSIRMIFYILCAYPNVLPYRDDRIWNDYNCDVQKLVYVIRHKLMNIKYSMDNNYHKELLSKLRFQHHYAVCSPSLQQTILHLEFNVRNRHLKYVDYAFALLCANLSPQYIENIIIPERLLPMISGYYYKIKETNDNDNSIVALLDTMSILFRLYLKRKTNAKLYLSLFARFLYGCDRQNVQEAAIRAILRMHHFYVVECFEILWNYAPPSGVLEDLTQEMLESFVYRHPLEFWARLCRSPFRRRTHQ